MDVFQIYIAVMIVLQWDVFNVVKLYILKQLVQGFLCYFYLVLMKEMEESNVNLRGRGVIVGSVKLLLFLSLIFSNWLTFCVEFYLEIIYIFIFCKRQMVCVFFLFIMYILELVGELIIVVIILIVLFLVILLGIIRECFYYIYYFEIIFFCGQEI